MAAPPATRPHADSLTPWAPGENAIESSAHGASGRSAARAFAPAGLTIVALTVLLLLPALFNGYPVLFADTADYLLRSRTLAPSPIRAPGYAVWIRLTSAGLTLWLPVIAQSALLAALIWRTLRAFGRPTAIATIIAGIVLVAGSSVAWASSKAMPDVFVAMLILGLYLVAVQWRPMGIAWRAVAIAAVLIGGTMHLTNLVVGASALVAIAALERAAAPRLTRGSVLRAAAALLASAGLAQAYQRAPQDARAVESNSDVFLLSHLVETGLAQRLLEDRCTTESFALCPVRDTLTRQVELFVWRPEQSPRYLVLHDDPVLIREETRHIMRGVIAHYPFALGLSVVKYTAEQFLTFRVNDDIWRHQNRTHVQRAIIAVFPGDLPAQESARQQANTLRLGWTTGAHLVVFLAAAAFSLVMLVRAASTDELAIDRAAGLHVVVWVTLVVNAAVCANAASVFARYQSRLSWLLPFAVVATLLERGVRHWPIRSPSDGARA